MEFTLSMTFTTSNGDKSTISIEGVKENLTQAEASTLMDAIIEKDIFLTKNGTLTGKYSAQLVQRQVTKLEVA